MTRPTPAPAAQAAAGDVWRAVDGDGTVHDVAVERVPPPEWAGWWRVVGTRGTSLASMSPRASVVLWAMDRMGIAEILSPGEPSRAELTADLARLRAPLTGALAAIEARAVAATPDAVTYSYEGLTRGENPRHRFSICNGTWEDEPTRPHRCIAMVYSDSEDSAPDADFYANARRDVFMLLAHVRRLTAALADSDARVASAVAAARDDERERAASVAESHAIDCDLDAEDERTNGTLGGCTVAQDRAKLARMIRDGIRKPACTICEEPATCFGSSEGDPPSYHCDDCCGHGGEDGHCEPVGADAIATTPATGGAQ